MGKSTNSEKNNSRVILTLSNDLIDIYSNMAKKSGMSRASMMSYALQFYLDYKQNMDMLPSLLEMVKKTENNNKDNNENQ